MEPVDFYNQQIQNLEIDLEKLQKRKSYFGWLRFGTIATIIIVFYILWSIGILYVIIVSVLLLAIFVKLIYADLENKGAIKYTKVIININKNELKYLGGDY